MELSCTISGYVCKNAQGLNCHMRAEHADQVELNCGFCARGAVFCDSGLSSCMPRLLDLCFCHTIMADEDQVVPAEPVMPI